MTRTTICVYHQNNLNQLLFRRIKNGSRVFAGPDRVPTGGLQSHKRWFRWRNPSWPSNEMIIGTQVGKRMFCWEVNEQHGSACLHLSRCDVHSLHEAERNDRRIFVYERSRLSIQYVIRHKQSNQYLKLQNRRVVFTGRLEEADPWHL